MSIRPTMTTAYQRGLGSTARARAAREGSTPSGGVYTDFLRTFDLGTVRTPSLGRWTVAPAWTHPSLSCTGEEVSMSRSVRWRRLSLWTALVPVVALVAGLLFATSSRTALGTDLRAGESTQLFQLIQQRQAT